MFVFLVFFLPVSCQIFGCVSGCHDNLRHTKLRFACQTPFLRTYVRTYKAKLCMRSFVCEALYAKLCMRSFSRKTNPLWGAMPYQSVGNTFATHAAHLQCQSTIGNTSSVLRTKRSFVRRDMVVDWYCTGCTRQVYHTKQRVCSSVG